MNKKLKAIIVFILIFALILPACGSQTVEEEIQAVPAETPTPTPEPTPEPTPVPTPVVLHESGPYLDGFDLHYAGDDGIDIVNGSVGFLNFDENGIYTSGNKDLDAKIREIFEEELDKDTQTRDEMLKTIYNYVVFGFGYGGGLHHEYGETGWEVDDALEMLDRGKGNCYTYAALFTMFARALGYQAEAVAGEFRAGEHSWTEITTEDGEVLISDSEYQACNDWNNSYFNMDESRARSGCYDNPNRKADTEVTE